METVRKGEKTATACYFTPKSSDLTEAGYKLTMKPGNRAVGSTLAIVRGAFDSDQA